ncbi:MAG: SufD family Fe-S cluster assembly protein [Candidatus Nanohaloarchaeota archaeon QJJ-7]|nr:SufD family Fe-S cluster assembly protein [Candidatus Nanohaloarchaeota archaeon QJJ-7]
MAEMEGPESVRTPGRVWTEFPEDLGEEGEGELRVEAPDDVEVREAVKPELFREADVKNAVTEHHSKLLEEENTVFVRIPEDTVVEEPIRIDTRIGSGFFPHHVLVIAGEGSAARVVERNQGDGRVDSSITEVIVEEGADLRFERLNELGEAVGYSDSYAEVGKDARIGWTVMSTGSELYRSSVRTELTGPRSKLDYRLGFLSSGEQHMDHSSHVIHSADNTRCDMDSRGVALDSSRAVYKGVQEVKQGAEGTKSFQDERTVLVGEEAEADTTPQLRIDNHDVEATHAATTGHVDDEDLFYMMSRGLREVEAKRELIQGMFDDLLDSDGAEEAIYRNVEESLS